MWLLVINIKTVQFVLLFVFLPWVVSLGDLTQSLDIDKDHKIDISETFVHFLRKRSNVLFVPLSSSSETVDPLFRQSSPCVSFVSHALAG